MRFIGYYGCRIGRYLQTDPVSYLWYPHFLLFCSSRSSKILRRAEFYTEIF
jgi:hypothetical protein